MSDKEHKGRPQPEETEGLFKGWQGDPIGTLAQHMHESLPADLLDKGAVMLPVPSLLQHQGGLPPNIAMANSKWLRVANGRHSDFALIKNGGPGNKQARVFWLDEAALGRHAGEEHVTPDLERKLHDRLQDMITGLCAARGIDPHEIEGRVCLLQEKVRRKSGNFTCGAVVLATSTYYAPLLDAMSEVIEEKRQAPENEAPAKEAGLTDKLQPRPLIAAPAVGRDKRLPYDKRREVKKFAAARKEAAAAALGTQAETATKPESDSALDQLLRGTVGEFHYTEITNEHAFVPAISTMGMPLSVRLNFAAPPGGAHKTTHVMTFQLNDPAFMELYARAKRFPPHSTECVRALDAASARVAPILNHMYAKFDVKEMEGGPILLDREDMVPLVAVIIHSNEQRDMLQEACRDFNGRVHELRSAGPVAPTAPPPAEPEQVPSSGSELVPMRKQWARPPNLVRDGIDDVVPEELMQLLQHTVQHPEIRQIGPQGKINVRAYTGTGKILEAALPPFMTKGENPASHVFACWLAEPRLKHLHAQRRAAPDRAAREAIDVQMRDVIAPLRNYFEASTGQKGKWYSLDTTDNGPVFVALSLTGPEQETKLDRFAEKLQDALALTRTRQASRRTQGDGDSQKGR